MIDAMFGRATPTRQFVGLVSQVRIRCIRHMPSAMPTITLRPQGWRRSPDKIEPEDLLRRVLTTAESPAPKPEVPDVEKLLQQLVRETQSRPPAVVSPPVPTAFEQMLRTASTTAAASATATCPTRLDRCGVFLMWEVRACTDTCPNLDESFPFLQPGWRTEKTPGGFIMIPPRGDNGPPAGRKRRLIREGGFASRVSGHVRPRDPGGGTVSTVSPRRMTIDDVSQAVEQSGGGGDPQLAPFPGFRQCGLKRLWLRTLLDGSVRMMMLDYDCRRALCGC